MLDASGIDFLKGYNPALAAIAVLLPLFAGKQLTDWIDVVGWSRRRDVQHLKAALDGSTLPEGTTRDALAEHLQARAFEAFVGIYAESEMRDGLIALHADLAPLADWRLIRRARPFLYVCEEQGGEKRRRVQPVLKGTDKLTWVFFLVLSWLVAALGLLALFSVLLAASTPQYAAASLKGLLVCILILFASAFLFSQTWPYADARKIERALSARGKLLLDATPASFSSVRLPPNEALKLSGSQGPSATPLGTG